MATATSPHDRPPQGSPGPYTHRSPWCLGRILKTSSVSDRFYILSGTLYEECIPGLSAPSLAHQQSERPALRRASGRPPRHRSWRWPQSISCAFAGSLQAARPRQHLPLCRLNQNAGHRRDQTGETVAAMETPIFFPAGCPLQSGLHSLAVLASPAPSKQSALAFIFTLPVGARAPANASWALPTHQPPCGSSKQL